MIPITTSNSTSVKPAGPGGHERREWTGDGRSM